MVKYLQYIQEQALEEYEMQSKNLTMFIFININSGLVARVVIIASSRKKAEEILFNDYSYDNYRDWEIEEERPLSLLKEGDFFIV